MFGSEIAGRVVLWCVLVSTVTPLSIAQIDSQKPVAAVPRHDLVITVSDENGVAVSAARVSLLTPLQDQRLRCETDFAGHCQFTALAPGTYQLRIEKELYYAVFLPTLQVEATGNVDVILSRQQEVREVVNVVESPPAVDPTQISSQEKLSGLDILNIPYPNTRDYRNALNFIPGVVQDVAGQPHIAGAEAYQTLTLLDGFNVTQPANGLLLVRVSSDSFQSVTAETSRVPAEYGKASGGVLSMNTGIGDDHFRFSATNFTPSLQNKKGLRFDSVDPRLTFSGPLGKRKIWFFDAADGEYDNIVVPELTIGHDSDHVWRASNLAKVQANFTQRSILTTSFLINRYHDDHLGLSIQNPASATPTDDESAYVATVKEQYSLGGNLLETGVAFDQYNLSEHPLGALSYFISPKSAGGNYYLAAHSRAQRWQALSNLYLRPWQWSGRHELKLGIDLDRLSYDAHFFRQPISFLREGQTLPMNGTCLTVNPSPCIRYSVFSGGTDSTARNLEASVYVEDRWLISNHLLLQPGIRFDWDEILRRDLFSPRLAGTYVLDSGGNTKLAGGLGIVYDATNLFLIARQSAGERLDYFFDKNGDSLGAPVVTSFSASSSMLQAPRVLNWSVGLERKLPASIYLKAEFLQKCGINGFVYNTAKGTQSGDFTLQNTRQDRYDAFQLGLRRRFQKSYALAASYTRSRSRSNQVLDFNVDDPILSPQAAGPYPWDTPNRFLSWGLLPFFRLPVIKEFDVAYSMEARSGFPFNVTNDQERLVERPGSRRFPRYFSLNLHLEKRFRLFGYHWAVRGGFDNITDHENPGVVNNNVDSTQFLTFSALRRRAFTTRIRFLGRK
jgi:hypothetical protein